MSSSESFVIEGNPHETDADATEMLDDTRMTVKVVHEESKEDSNDDSEEEVEVEKEADVADPEGDFDELNGEALDALEESLKLQMEGLLKQEREFEEMYSRVSSQLETCNMEVVADIEDLKIKIEEVDSDTKTLILERDADLADIRNTEQAFTDVHRKYERAMTTLENTKASEDVLKQKAEELELMVGRMDLGQKTLKQEAHGKVIETFEGYLAKIANLEMENAKLKAVNRRADMRAETLDSDLIRKQHENEELSNLADELIGRSASGAL